MIIFVLITDDLHDLYTILGLSFGLAKLKCKSAGQGGNVEAIVYVNTISIMGCNLC